MGYHPPHWGGNYFDAVANALEKKKNLECESLKQLQEELRDMQDSVQGTHSLRQMEPSGSRKAFHEILTKWRHNKE
jgi:CHAD domain-containing protein